MPHWTMAVVRRTPNLSHAKAEDGSRAYHAKVRAWWDFCRPHRLPPLSGSPAGVVAQFAMKAAARCLEGSLAHPSICYLLDSRYLIDAWYQYYSGYHLSRTTVLVDGKQALQAFIAIGEL